MSLGFAQRLVPVSYPKMKPPIDTKTPMARDRMLKNLTGESSYTPASLSRSGDTWVPAFALSFSKSAFSVCLDREKSPMLDYVMLLLTSEKAKRFRIVADGVGASPSYNYIWAFGLVCQGLSGEWRVESGERDERLKIRAVFMGNDVVRILVIWGHRLLAARGCN